MMDWSWLPLVTVAIFAPLAGAVALSLLPVRPPRIYWFGLAFAAIPLFIWLFLASRFRGAGGFEFAEFYPWIDFFHVHYWVGIDGLSLYFFGMTIGLGCLVLLWHVGHRDSSRSQAILFLALQTSLLGVFASLDLFLFYLFMEGGVIAAYFLIGLQEESRGAAARSFLVFNLLGSGAFLLVMAKLYVLANGSLNLADLMVLAMEPREQRSLSLLFLLAVMLKTAVVPFHLWLSPVITSLSAGGRVLLLAIFLKVFYYALWRYGFPLFPAGAGELRPLLGVVGIATFWYGSFLALQPRRLETLVVYWSLSLVGLALFGISLAGGGGAEGTLYHLLSHGVLVGLLLFVADALADETAHFRTQIVWRAVGIVALVAASGLPGTVGFIGPWLIGLASLEAGRGELAAFIAGWFVFSLSLARALFRIFLTPAERPVGETISWQRWAVAVSLLAALVVGGLYSQPVLGPARSALTKIFRERNGVHDTSS